MSVTGGQILLLKHAAEVKQYGDCERWGSATVLNLFGHTDTHTHTHSTRCIDYHIHVNAVFKAAAEQLLQR